MRYAVPQWPAWTWILALTAITPLPTALGPWPLKLLVDSATDAVPLPPGITRSLGALGVHDSGTTLVIVAAAATLGLFLLGSALEAGLSFASTAAAQRMVYALAADIFWHLQRLSLLLHRRQTVGDSLSRLTGDSWCIYTVTEAALVTPAQHLLTLATVGIVAWRLDPMLTLLSLTIAPALAAVVVFVGPKLKRHARLQRRTESALVSAVHQTLSSIPLAQAFCAETRNVERYQQITGAATALGQQAGVLRNAYAALLGLVAATGTALVMLIGARRVLSGALSVGGLLVFIAYLRVLQGAAQGLLVTHGTLRTAHASVERVLEVLDSPDRITDSAAAVPLSVPVTGLELDLDHVTFGYEAGKPVLRSVELHVSPGQVMALVGATGAGKSTLAALVPRLIDPWQGSVRLNGSDLRELTIQSLREHVAIVPQEPFLLPLSVAENIGYGRQGACTAEIVRAAEAAGAAEFIEELPQGYETVLGERGSTLSGGQRQRLAIARAILKDAPVLILDEPTSSLDARTEHEVMGALRRLMAGRTCLVIAHRLSTIRGADCIAVLEAGRIVERGRHLDLISRKGVYARLCDVQRIGGRDHR